jgi:hypothetical protein
METILIGLGVYYLVTRITPIILYILFAKRFFGGDDGPMLQFAVLITLCFIPGLGEMVYSLLGLVGLIAGIFMIANRGK